MQPIILSILSEGPCHGYVILQKIGQTRLWGGVDPDPAGVYRALRDMEERGLICAKVDGQTRTGAERKVFQLTEEGVACRRSWLETLREYRLGLDEVIDALAEITDASE